MKHSNIKHIAILVLMLCAAVGVQAQNVQFKVGGGFSSHYDGSSQLVGAFKVGVGYEWEFNQHWTFTPTLSVYGKGWKDPNQRVFVYDDSGNQRFDEETGEPLTSIRNRTTTANYVEVPLLFSYYFRTGESRYVVLSAGPYVAYGISGKQKTKGDAERPGSEKLYYEDKTFDEKGVYAFDAGVQVMAGYAFPSGFTLGVEADFGVTKFNKAGDRNVSALISLGYKL